jgi:DNA repair exonuclease SbcCD ATPase subunit
VLGAVGARNGLRVMSTEVSPGSTARNDKLKKQIHDDLTELERRLAKLKVDELRAQGSSKSLDRQIDLMESRKAAYRRQIAQRDRHREVERAALDAQREMIAMGREKRRENIREALEKTQEAKRDTRDQIRQLHLINKVELDYQRAASHEVALSKHDTIRETDSRAKTKAMRQTAARIESIREHERIAVERDAVERDEKIRKLRKLQKEEEALKRRVESARSKVSEKLEKLDEIRPTTRQSLRSPSSRSDREAALPPISP